MWEKLAEVFDNYLVALQHEIEWPPRSTAFFPCDFFCGVTWNLECSLSWTNFFRTVVWAIEKSSHLCIENSGRHV